MVVPIKFVFCVNNLKSSFINTKYNISISAHTESVTGLRLNSQGFNLVIILNLQVWQKHKVFAKTFKGTIYFYNCRDYVSTSEVWHREQVYLIKPSKIY